EHEGKLYVVASFGGSDKAPDWYLNVVANPEVTVEGRWAPGSCRARTLAPEERQEMWPRQVAMYPAYADYQKRTSRTIRCPVCHRNVLETDQVIYLAVTQITAEMEFFGSGNIAPSFGRSLDHVKCAAIEKRHPKARFLFGTAWFKKPDLDEPIRGCKGIFLGDLPNFCQRTRCLFCFFAFQLVHTTTRKLSAKSLFKSESRDLRERIL